MSKESAPPQGQKEVRILVADDDEGMRGMLSLLFSRLGYRVVVAENGLQALDLFSRNSFSLVVTDLCMPEMDGLTLAARVKIASPDTPVIMITGSLIQEGTDTNCVDYIVSKPFQLEAMHHTVEMALDRAIFRPRIDPGAEIQLQG